MDKAGPCPPGIQQSGKGQQVRDAERSLQPRERARAYDQNNNVLSEWDDLVSQLLTRGVVASTVTSTRCGQAPFPWVTQMQCLLLTRCTLAAGKIPRRPRGNVPESLSAL